MKEEMTANELADWIENGAPFGDYETAKQSVAMLRQQQAELNEAGHMICMLRWEIEQLQDRLNEFLVARDLAILRKASEK
jgi:hypothetical protein